MSVYCPCMGLQCAQWGLIEQNDNGEICTFAGVVYMQGCSLNVIATKLKNEKKTLY